MGAHAECCSTLHPCVGGLGVGGSGRGLGVGFFSTRSARLDMVGVVIYGEGKLLNTLARGLALHVVLPTLSGERRLTEIGRL